MAIQRGLESEERAGDSIAAVVSQLRSASEADQERAAVMLCEIASDSTGRRGLIEAGRQ